MASQKGVDYVAALQEIGFPADWAARRALIIENERRDGRYRGFRSAINMAQIAGAPTPWQPHHYEPVIRRVEAQEAAASAARRAAEAAAAVEARRLEEVDALTAQVRELQEQAAELAAFRRIVTDDELDGRVPMRPHVAEAFRRATGHTGEFPHRAAQRPSWVGRAPAPKRLRESAGGLLVAERAKSPAGAAAVGTDVDVVPIQIIRPGWGSSGWYSREVLQRAAADKVIVAGTHMHLDHPSVSEREDRPERSVRTLAAVLTEDASWDEKRGALVAKARLLAPHSEELRAKAPHIGVSILGSATDITMGTAEGRSGPIIEGLAKVDSIDFVTHAGREGRVLLESQRRPRLAQAGGLAETFRGLGLSDDAARVAAAGR